MEKISQSQLAALIIMSQLGSSPLFLLGKGADKDAWLVVLIAMTVGLGLLIVTLLIHRLEPDKELIEIMKVYCGKYIGYGLGIMYFIYFSYESVRNVREFGDLIGTFLLQTTPLWILVGSILLLAGYAVWHGLEVFSRIVQVLAPLILLIYIVFFILIYASGLIDVHQIEPILENGSGKVIDAAFPELISFPFGEMVLFLMFWKFVDPAKKVASISIRYYLLAGSFISFTNLIILTCLGPISQMSVAPFIQMASLIRFQSYLERLDPFASTLLFTGVFVKITVYFLGASFVGKHLVKTDHRYIVTGVGIALFSGALMFQSYIQQVWIGFQYDVNYVFPIFQFYIPLLLLLLMLVRRRIRMKKVEDS